MARRFGTFESLLAQLRDPLEAEFRSRRDGHVELINLRAASIDNGARLEAATVEVRKLADALAESEARAEDLAARLREQTAASQEARVEADRHAANCRWRPARSRRSRRVNASPVSGSRNLNRTRRPCAPS
ncbi:hypothetical protein [Brevundimonas sp. TWP2-3-4b1]|uniref:hypothetical protein n=1 Tax=Brevundimonas sp. TWP2-3-4b1 TaxID=2804580 RepID=UPI003CECEDDB